MPRAAPPHGLAGVHPGGNVCHAHPERQVALVLGRAGREAHRERIAMNKGKFLRKGRYLNLKQQGYNLLLVPTAEGRREARRLLGTVSSDRALVDLLEDHLGNGWDILAPEEIGALTEAPIIAESDEIFRNDRNEVVLAGKIYYFDKYAILDEIEEFAKGKSVMFSGFGKPVPAEANDEYIELREREDRGQRVDWRAFSKKYGQ
jgi:hypothetical protein